MMLREWWLKQKLSRALNNDKASLFPCLELHYHYLLTQLDKPISELNLLAIDIEMTGLNAKKEQMVSIGAIPIINAQIKPKLAQYKLIKIQGSVGQSAIIHGVLDRDLSNALSLPEVLTWLFEQCQDKILVAHHAPLDLQFLQQAMLKTQSSPLTLFAIDTLNIEKQRQLRKNTALKTGGLRLNACRDYYHLPVYNAHNALTDALACAELLLAQLNGMGELGKTPLKKILNYC
ncbi:exonuclease domain-containing protein [Psychromonas aquatilis]|uniref:Exonuclease domain-containing protein n=1 Tax=Psychromonas aquatilis TaxID=2005072 RepID=A0ABU9GP17_9GAMM